MDENTLGTLKKILADEEITAALPHLIDLTLEFGRQIPDDVTAELDATGKDWQYYNFMIHYAIQWYQLGSSPSKLKKLMDEAIGDLSGPENNSGKRSASRMFMDYLHYKKDIDTYLKIKLSS